MNTILSDSEIETIAIQTFAVVDGMPDDEVSGKTWDRCLARAVEAEVLKRVSHVNPDSRDEWEVESAQVEPVKPQEPAARGAQFQTPHHFQNFHRLLCERFGYVHDPVDWWRDQLSLIEHIAALAVKPCLAEHFKQCNAIAAPGMVLVPLKPTVAALDNASTLLAAVMDELRFQMSQDLFDHIDAYLASLVRPTAQGERA